MNPAQPLIDFQRTKPFFIGIDSDGCVFDTMELKHKECFIPNIIRHFELQPISRYARTAAEFVNLYSKWRGCNRFPALSRTLDLLEDWPEARQRHAAIPRLAAMRRWLEQEPKPSEPALERAVAQADGDAGRELQRVLEWSRAVNATIAEMVRNVPPFPFVRESLAAAVEQADLIVVSATPGEALNREWAEHDIASHVTVIAGQEMGKKAEHLRLATNGEYDDGHVLMIGDAPGDLDAARSISARFFPIVPGAEAQSWQRFREEGLPRFLDGTYRGTYEAQLIAEFRVHLPETPPWKRTAG